MTEDIAIVAPPTALTLSVEMEPIFHFLSSLTMLNDTEDFPGLSDWLVQTAQAMSPALHRDTALFLGPLSKAIYPEKNLTLLDIPAYLDVLAGEDAVAMRDRALEKFCCDEGEEGPTPETLLADLNAYLAVIKEKYREKDVLEHYDPELHKDAHALLQDPDLLKTRAVAHFRRLWGDYMADEWARVAPMLEESVAAFQHLDLDAMDMPEAFRAVTGRPLPERWQELIDEFLGDGGKLTFYPSAHLGPYLTMSIESGSAWVGFGARMPEGVSVRSPALSRSELLVRLGALADDTRLSILELLTQEEELYAQDVIERLDISQSAASRHLRHLSASGYTLVQRKEGGKCYRLNRERVEDTLQALSEFFK